MREAQIYIEKHFKKEKSPSVGGCRRLSIGGYLPPLVGV